MEGVYSQSGGDRMKIILFVAAEFCDGPQGTGATMSAVSPSECRDHLSVRTVRNDAASGYVLLLYDLLETL